MRGIGRNKDNYRDKDRILGQPQELVHGQRHDRDKVNARTGNRKGIESRVEAITGKRTQTGTQSVTGTQLATGIEVQTGKESG